MPKTIIHENVEYANEIYRAFVVPITIVFGIFGNIIIIIVLSRQYVGRFEVYCFTLAVVQSLALIFNSFLDDFLGRGLEFITYRKYTVKIDNYSDDMCRFIEFIPPVMYFISAYVMVVMGIDRYLVINRNVRFPAPNLYVVRAKWICMVISVLGVLSSSPLLWFYYVDKQSYENKHFDNKSCKLTNSYFSDGLLYFQSILVFVIPIFIVVVCNFMIVLRLFKRRTLRKRLSSASSFKKDPNSGSMKLIGYLAISSGFLLVSLPLAVTIIVRSVITGSFQPGRTDVNVTLSEASKLTSSIKDFHYGINFYLNIGFLDRFRKDVKMLFSCGNRSRKDDYSTRRNLTKSEE